MIPLVVRLVEFVAISRDVVSVDWVHEFFLAAEEIVAIEPVPTAAGVIRGNGRRWSYPLVAPSG